MAGRVVHSFFADGRQNATAVRDGGRRYRLTADAMYNGRRVKSLLAPIHGEMSFIHEWHG